jgi:hypothetical protein
MDMFEPVRLKSEEFSELVSGLERAFSSHAAALVMDERLSGAELEVLDWDKTGLDKDAIEKYREIVQYFDQLVVFAFAQAPNDVISDWAARYDASLKEEAISRVDIMRSDLPSLQNLWDAKTSSVIPILSSLGYEIVAATDVDGGADKSVILRLSASKVNVLGQVDRYSTQSVTMRLWPSDLVLLKDQIDHTLETHLDQGGQP